MTASTIPRAKYNVADRYREHEVDSGETIEPGELVGITATNLAEEGASTSPAIGGWSSDSAIRTAGEMLRFQEGEKWLAHDGTVSAATVPAIAYCSDSVTVTLTRSAAEPVVGIVVDFDATNDLALVRIDLALNGAIQALLDAIGT